METTTQQRFSSSSNTQPEQQLFQRPLVIHNSFLTSSITDPKADSIILPNQSIMSARTRKHYSDNLYAVLDDGLTSKKRLSRNTLGVCNPILESLAGMQKMLITKQALRSYKDKRMKKEVKFHLESVDENLDIGDPFQSPGFSLNVDNPRVLEFRMDHLNGMDIDDSMIRNFSKINENLEHSFNNKGFRINLTEGEATKTIGSVNLINQDYHVFDVNGNYLFQLERRTSAQGQDQLVAVKKRGGEGDIEMAKADLGAWRRLTLETEIVYGGFCSAKEKLMILGAVLVVMMKMTVKNINTRSEGGRDACSVGGLWKDWMRKMRSIF